MKKQVYDLLIDGELWTEQRIASSLLVPSFAITNVLRELGIDGQIQFEGPLKGYRRKKLSSRQPHLDKQVDEMLVSAKPGHQPNDQTRVIIPQGFSQLDEMGFDLPDSWKDEPHWIRDAMGWYYRPEEADASGKERGPTESIFRYLGGKSKMLDDLVKWFPSCMCYVECFGGSLKPFFAKDPSPIEVVNDYNADLINFWRMASQWPEELAGHVNSIPASRTLHRLFQRQDGTRSPWERAVMFGALLRFSFNGKPWSSYGGSPSSPATKLNADLMGQAAKRLSGSHVYIENLDFRDLIKRYNKKLPKGQVFFYLDPPYYQTAGYADAFPDEWHRELADLMVEIHEAGNKVLMTNSPKAKEAYQGFFGSDSIKFRFEEYNVHYSAAGGAGGRGDVAETIISNFKLAVSSQKRQGGMF
jgi:DNA adenine methylase